MKNIKLLLVDDEISILQLLQLLLKKEGFEYIYTATNGHDAILLCEKIHPDLIMLDIMLPDCNGFFLCNELRKKTSVPILFLTAKVDDIDKLTGFDCGGDDYITKPFNHLEVIARIKAQLRRQKLTEFSNDDTSYDFGYFQIYERSGRLIVNKEEIFCPTKELQLLIFLCKNPNLIFSKKQLYEQIWGEDSYGNEATVTVHINRLREKIEPNPSQPSYLITKRGLGYKLLKSVRMAE
ncbi:response regulator transcription factor [Lysinibacillus sp. NPDC094403]|uniref:response regulator transcription factor n=1 Tax=Lysinibacillus sp. NPDC094403 TaxID=3390581 RepID=UPI003D026219